MSAFGDRPFGDGPSGRDAFGDDPFGRAAFGSSPFGRDALDDDAFDDDFSPRLARPYAVTQGRTEAAVDLPVEALIETIHEVSFDAFHQSQARIVDLCRTPLSVAEISAELGIALGVARVLIGDLIVDGIVRRHEIISMEADRDQWRYLLERTLAGLRAI